MRIDEIIYWQFWKITSVVERKLYPQLKISTTSTDGNPFSVSEEPATQFSVRSF